MIEVDIVTPTRKLVEGAKVSSLKIPAKRGEIQIFPGHTDLMSVLGTGPLSFVEDGRERKFAVSYGFLEVRHDKVLVLAETAEEATDIDLNRAKNAQKKAQDALTGVLTEDTFQKHQLKLQRSLVRQQVAGNH